MNLIDKYIAEVGKHLPRKQRADIEAEIRSTLEDMLDERNQAGTSDEAQISALLKEYGDPKKVAESYAGPRYLIGPRMYPIFELITKIVMAALLGAGLLAYGISGAITKSLTGVEFLSFLGQFWVNFLGGMISAFGNLVIVFAILERFVPASEFEKDADKEWDPAELAQEPDPDEIKLSEPIATIIFTVAGLLIFNFYPNLIGFGFVFDGKWMFVPALSGAFFKYLPWVNLLGLVQIGFSLYQLRQRAWTTALRVINLFIELGTIALAAAMLTGPALIDLSADKLAGTPVAEAAEVLTRVMGFVPALVLIIVIVVSAIEVAQMTYCLLKNRPAPPYPLTK
jgi:hypothetical protein